MYVNYFCKRILMKNKKIKLNFYFHCFFIRENFPFTTDVIRFCQNYEKCLSLRCKKEKTRFDFVFV